MLLHTAQSIIAKDKHRFRVLRCGRRFGKTMLIVEEIKGLAIACESRIAYIANNYQQARDIAWEILKKELAGVLVAANEARLELKIKNMEGTTSLIVLRGWESIENLRGQAFDFLAVDEVAMMSNFWVGWQEVLRPTLTDRKGSVLFASTPKGYNHFFDLNNLELQDPNFKSFHFTSYDNPHLPFDEIETAKQTLPKDRFVQEYMADFSKTTGLVYKEFNREFSTYDVLPFGEYQKLGAIDFGYVNPCAVLDVRFDGERYYIEDEWYKTQQTEPQIAEYVAAQGFEAVYPDPENPSAIRQLQDKRVNVREVSKTKDSIQSGINLIRELLLTKKLMVNKRCINLITEFETYSYGDTENEKNKNENPVKSNDHALDALRYVVMMTYLSFNKRKKKKEKSNSPVRRGVGMRGT